MVEAVDHFARASIQSHEKLCAERYETIKTNQTEAKTERQLMHLENKTRIDRLYNRMWAAAGVTILGMAAIIGGFIAWFMSFVMAGMTGHS